MSENGETNQEVKEARGVLTTEADALRLAGERLDGAFVRALEALDKPDGKIVVTGLGKSGHVGRKIAATFCSTGSPSVFMHASEAVHGDLGVYQPGDPTVFLSNSGTTSELVALAPMLRNRGSSIVGLLGNVDGPLGKEVDVALDASVLTEADPLGIVPTASFVVTAALGDALASGLMRLRSFTKEDYAGSHPGGQLGRNWGMTVGEVMHPLEEVALCGEDAGLRQLVIAMTERPLGAACVMREETFLGIVTDGDLRRALSGSEDVWALRAEAIMTRNPVTIHPSAPVGAALRLMEERDSQIAVLPVTSEGGGMLQGLLRLHDVYVPK